MVPTIPPTANPSRPPTLTPTTFPTPVPSSGPSSAPTFDPTTSPMLAPSKRISSFPTAAPSANTTSDSALSGTGEADPGGAGSFTTAGIVLAVCVVLMMMIVVVLLWKVRSNQHSGELATHDSSVENPQYEEIDQSHIANANPTVETPIYANLDPLPLDANATSTDYIHLHRPLHDTNTTSA
eukprot:m.249646 g.249646  ORF g.249646 m.249646 type:complete len:182 (-) comp15880_c0_seq3:124-669(-)